MIVPLNGGHDTPEAESKAETLPLPEMMVRGSHVSVMQIQPAPAQVVPVLSVRSLHVEIQLPLQDVTIGLLIDALTEVRRTRSGLTVATELPTDRAHP